MFMSKAHTTWRTIVVDVDHEYMGERSFSRVGEQAEGRGVRRGRGFFFFSKVSCFWKERKKDRKGKMARDYIK